MEPGIYNFPKLYKGDTFNGLAFEISLNGKALDLTNYIITMNIVSQKRSVMELDSQSGSITISDAKKGKFEILPFLVDIPSGNYDYDIQFEIEGNFYTYLKGKIQVTEDITK